MNNNRSTARQLAATALAAATLAAGTSAQATPVNVMDAMGKTLLGVDAIVVNGKNYNVRFVDGTCQALFSGCNANTNSFLFTNLADANAATSALGNAVFKSALPGSVNGLTLGYEGDAILTPWGFANTMVQSAGLLIQPTTNTNAFLEGPFNLTVASFTTSPTANLATSTTSTYASWSAGAAVPVPEPGSLALTAVGLGAVFLAGGKARRRRKA